MKRIMFRLYAITFIALACAALPASAASPIINEFRLANGIKVLHVERQNLPVVTMSILVKASPRDEEPSRAGLAYLTAKLLADGTTTRKGPEISEAIEFLGASLAANITADFTLLSYSSLKKDTASGLELVSDILLNPVFPEDEVERKKAITKGMLQQREEDPQYAAKRRFLKELFGKHPYGREAEGEPSTIDAVSRSDIWTFYSRSYRPDATVIALVGALSAQEAWQLLERFFGGWTPLTESPATVMIPSVEQSQAKRVIVNRDLTQASIIFGHRGISRAVCDYYAVQVMNYVLGGGGFASRLMQTVRDEMGLAYSIHSLFAANELTGSFSVEVQTKNASVSTVVSEIKRQMNRMRTELISDGELSDAKAYLTGSFPRRLETSKKLVDFLVVADFYGLGADYVRNYPSFINSITKEDVFEMSKRYLRPDRAILVVIGKESEMSLPDAQAPK